MFAGCSRGFYKHETIVFRVLTVKENRRIMERILSLNNWKATGNFRIVLLENVRERS